MRNVKELLWTNPNTLLGDRCVMGTNFNELGATSAMEQEYWVTQMELAISAAQHQRQRDAAMSNRVLPFSEL